MNGWLKGRIERLRRSRLSINDVRSCWDREQCHAYVGEAASVVARQWIEIFAVMTTEICSVGGSRSC